MGFGSPVHWLLVLLVVVLIFGTKKLRNIGSDLGGAVKGFKDGMKNGGNQAADDNAAAQPASQAAPQVTQHAAADKSAIDVEAKTKG